MRMTPEPGKLQNQEAAGTPPGSRGTERRKRLEAKGNAPGDPDVALAKAREIAGRDDAAAHLGSEG